MNTLELNKIAAAILLAGVVAMTLGLVARLLVPSHAAHGDGHGPNLFASLAPTAAPTSEAPAGPEPILALLAAADAAAGEQAARKCVSCHSFEAGGPNKVGPALYNTVGADKAHIEGYAYSNALAEMEGTWGYEELNQFLYRPRDYVPGTKMSFAGISKASERADIIAYLRQQTDNPPPLPEISEQTEAAPPPAETPQQTENPPPLPQ